MHPSLDLLNISAVELTSLLSNGSLTSLELVQAYLAQIDAHNHKGLCLNAVISTAPQGLLFDLAKRLDAERATGKLRSPLHGIPIIVKVLVSEILWRAQLTSRRTASSRLLSR